MLTNAENVIRYYYLIAMEALGYGKKNGKNGAISK